MKDNKLNRFFLLIRCLVRALFFGKAVRDVGVPSAVIVVLTGKLGDIVCGTPVLKAIRGNLPNTRIVIAKTSGVVQPILSHSGLVDDYIDFNSKNVIKEIKKHNIEAGFVTGPSFVPTALLYISGIPLIVAPKIIGGFSPLETRLYKILQKFIKIYLYEMGKYAPRERLKCLEHLGIVSNNTKKHLGFSETADKKIKQFFIDNKINLEKDFIVGISPSAGNKIKEWPEERFTEVADYLIEKHKAKVFLIGGAEDSQKVQNVIKKLKNKNNVINTQGGFNIDELKAFISKLNLFISVDTGPIYIAEAFGVPTIDIVGPIDEREQPPIDKIHRVIVPERDKPELFVLNARCYDKKEAIRQLESITISIVKNEINLLITDIKRYK